MTPLEELRKRFIWIIACHDGPDENEYGPIEYDIVISIAQMRAVLKATTCRCVDCGGDQGHHDPWCSWIKQIVGDCDHLHAEFWSSRWEDDNDSTYAVIEVGGKKVWDCWGYADDPDFISDVAEAKRKYGIV